MTNEQLVALIQAGEDVADNMLLLYNQIKPFIHTVALRYRSDAELEDLEQEGYLALYPAVDGYDPAAGCKFLTYAEKWMRQRMQRYLQTCGSCFRLPAHCLEKVQRYHRFCENYEKSNGAQPSDRTVSRYLCISVEQVESLRLNACMANLGSLDVPVTGINGNEDSTVGDLVAAPGDLADEITERMDAEALGCVLWGCVDELPDDQRDVIRKRYQDGETFPAIGSQLGSDPHVAQRIHNKAIRTLRGTRYTKRLRPFLPEADRIYSCALWGNGVGRFNRTWTSSTERVALDL